MSERVEREFKEWQDRYEIPYDQEFQVKTLLKLQEEYDGVKVGSDTTRTREVLLDMIRKIHSSLILKQKENKRVMYVDCIAREGLELDKILIYIDGEIRYSKKVGTEKMNIKNCACIIRDIAIHEKANIYIDIRGFGIGLYDSLKEFNDIVVKELEVKRFM